MIQNDHIPKWNFNLRTEHAIGFGIVIGNLQPKKKYKTAIWQFSMIVLCFAIDIEYSYRYKNYPPL